MHAGSTEKAAIGAPRMVGRRASAFGPAALGLAAFTAATLLYAVMVGTGHGRELDAVIVDLELENPSRRLAVLAGLVINPLSVPIATIVLAGLAARRHGLADGIACATIAGGAVLIATLLKAGLAFVDPTGQESQRALGEGFFPSGHTSAAMGLCLAAMLAARNRDSPALPAAAAVVATVLAYPHILTAWHHASDVPGALLLTTGWAALVVGVFRRRAVSMPSSPGLPGRRVWLGVAALAVVAGLVELGRRLPALEIESFQPLQFFHPLLVLSGLAVAAVSALSTYAFARVLRSFSARGER